MKILAFSDWRIQSLEALAAKAKELKPDLVLYAGDDLERVVPVINRLLVKVGKQKIVVNLPQFLPSCDTTTIEFTPQSIHLITKYIETHNSKVDCLRDLPMYYVVGNDDCLQEFEGGTYLDLNGCAPMSIGGFFVEGSWHKLYLNKKGQVANCLEDDHGSMEKKNVKIYFEITPLKGQDSFSTGSETVTIAGSSCTYGLRAKAIATPLNGADIYLSHVPPRGVLDLACRFGTEHIGSMKLRGAVLQFEPRLVICGHSHIWGGHSQMLGRSMVLNVSSNDHEGASGNYAIIDTSDWSIRHDAVATSNFNSIAGMSDLRKKYRDEVMFSEDHSETLKTLSVLSNRGDTAAERVRLRILSREWERPRIVKRLTIDIEGETFVDVETGRARGMDPGELWLVGILHRRTVVQFKVPCQEDELTRYLKQNEIKRLVSWSMYDKRALTPLLEKAGLTIQFIDACQRVRNSVVWHSYALSEIHRALVDDNAVNYDIDGRAAGLYADHLIIPRKSCKYCPSQSEVERRIMKKNLEDLLQMYEVCEFCRS